MGQQQSGRSTGRTQQHTLQSQQQNTTGSSSSSSSFETLVAPKVSSINDESETTESTVPYTSYSITKPEDEEGDKSVTKPPLKSQGIVVVGTKAPPSDMSQVYTNDVVSKLDKIHIFYPILKSSCGHGNQTLAEEMKDGLEATPILNMCLRYQEHLSTVASVMANEQMALAARFRDLELFVVGIQQQLLRRQDRLAKAAPHMQTASDISEILEKIQSQIDYCVPMMNRLNNLLPENDRMEKFEVSTEYHDPGDAMHYSEQTNIIGFNYSNIDSNS